MNKIEGQDRLRFAMMQSREEAGKTQREMAKLLGVHKNTINNWENGKSAPSYLDVINWYEALNLPIDNEYILYRQKYMEPIVVSEYVTSPTWLNNIKRFLKYYSLFVERNIKHEE